VIAAVAIPAKSQVENTEIAFVTRYDAIAIVIQ
jgi:hypothetical protein